MSRLRVRRDARSTDRDGNTEAAGVGGTTGIGAGRGSVSGGGGSRGGRAIGRNLERATKVAETETTAGVGERRQLARVYTTALCSRRPHRAVSESSGENVSICSDTSLARFLPVSPSLSLTPPRPSLLSLSLSPHFCPVSAKTALPIQNFFFPVSPFASPFAFLPFTSPIVPAR